MPEVSERGCEKAMIKENVVEKAGDDFSRLPWKPALIRVEDDGWISVIRRYEWTDIGPGFHADPEDEEAAWVFCDIKGTEALRAMLESIAYDARALRLGDFDYNLWCDEGLQKEFISRRPAKKQ